MSAPETSRSVTTGSSNVCSRMRLSWRRFKAGSRTSGRYAGEQLVQLLQQGRGTFSLCHVDIYQTSNLGWKTNVCGEEQDRHLRLNRTHSRGDLSAVHAWHGVVEDDGVDGVLL